MKRLLKYGILSALIFFPGFSGATTLTNHFELTSGTFDGAVSNCQSKGAGWDLTYAAGGSWYWVDQSNFTGWVKDTPSTLADHKCWYDPALENDKGAVVDGGTANAGDSCAGDMPKSNVAPGICLGQKCTYVAGYSAWGACNPATGLQVTINPFFNTVYGPTCTDIVALTQSCGVCKVVATTTERPENPNLCAFGTATVPTISGNNWIWNCNVASGANASCSASYIPAPNVTVTCNASGTGARISYATSNATTYAVRYDKNTPSWTGTCATINPGDICENTTASFKDVTTNPGVTNSFWVHAGNASGYVTAVSRVFTCPPPGPVVSLSVPNDALTNLNNDSATVSQKDATFTWTISDPGVCGAGGCTCVFTGPDGDSIEKLYNSSDITSRIQTVWSKEAGNHTAKVRCTSSSGVPSNEASATVVGSCNEYTYSTTCNKECGDESSTTKRVETNCTTTTVSTDSCNHPACPVSGEWREVSN